MTKFVRKPGDDPTLEQGRDVRAEGQGAAPIMDTSAQLVRDLMHSHKHTLGNRDRVTVMTERQSGYRETFAACNASAWQHVPIADLLAFTAGGIQERIKGVEQYRMLDIAQTAEMLRVIARRLRDGEKLPRKDLMKAQELLREQIKDCQEEFDFYHINAQKRVGYFTSAATALAIIEECIREDIGHPVSHERIMQNTNGVLADAIVNPLRQFDKYDLRNYENMKKHFTDAHEGLRIMEWDNVPPKILMEFAYRALTERKPGMQLYPLLELDGVADAMQAFTDSRGPFPTSFLYPPETVFKEFESACDREAGDLGPIRRAKGPDGSGIPTDGEQKIARFRQILSQARIVWKRRESEEKF